MKPRLMLTGLVVATLGISSSVFATGTEKATTPHDQRPLPRPRCEL